jgi:hypothetical protein
MQKAYYNFPKVAIGKSLKTSAQSKITVMRQFTSIAGMQYLFVIAEVIPQVTNKCTPSSAEKAKYI